MKNIQNTTPIVNNPIRNISCLPKEKKKKRKCKSQATIEIREVYFEFLPDRLESKSNFEHIGEFTIVFAATLSSNDCYLNDRSIRESRTKSLIQGILGFTTVFVGRSRLLIPSACEMSTRTVYPPLHLYLYIWRLPPNVYGETGGTRSVVLVISSKAATSNGTSPMTQLLILMPINSRLSCLKKTNGFIDILSLINSGPGAQKRISKHIISYI